MLYEESAPLKILFRMRMVVGACSEPVLDLHCYHESKFSDVALVEGCSVSDADHVLVIRALRKDGTLRHNPSGMRVRLCS